MKAPFAAYRHFDSMRYLSAGKPAHWQPVVDDILFRIKMLNTSSRTAISHLCETALILSGSRPPYKYGAEDEISFVSEADRERDMA